MKLLNVLILFLLNVLIVAETQANSFYTTYPKLIREGELVSENDYKKRKIEPYYPNSEIYYYKDSDSYYELKALPNGIIMMRDPKTGIANFGLADLGDFPEQSWQSLCIKDEITDAVTCMINNESLTIMYNNGRQMISSVKDVNNLDFNKKQYVRIDVNTAISANGIIENPKFSEIVRQMSNGKTIKTRYFDIHGVEHNTNSSLSGFRYAYEYLIKSKDELKNSLK
ncbi:hypothetical protein MMP65_06030 [Acinetobacter sp. ANC 3926]|jgi:hypothetical protein|uniref:hypothetical protein n=1 Tax=Acinetobacter genomosp. 15BJ TaxID=106651 RepID=UPI001F4B8876|nr:hypothetical protein [Acinetobacter genomosp. 15BJ]MCH7291019.1 hypothetical protein [Acinetobacter genomosp. 15BJ]